MYHISFLLFLVRKMAEESYYVKAMVDGKAIDDDNLCDGDPTSSSCTYVVSKTDIYTCTFDAKHVG